MKTCSISLSEIRFVFHKVILAAVLERYIDIPVIGFDFTAV